MRGEVGPWKQRAGRAFWIDTGSVAHLFHFFSAAANFEVPQAKGVIRGSRK